MSSTRYVPLHLLILGSAVGGATVLWSWQKFTRKGPPDGEEDHQVGHSLVWSSISGAMNAAMMYTGDKLKLYETMRELCQEPGSYATAIDIAKETVRTHILKEEEFGRFSILCTHISLLSFRDTTKDGFENGSHNRRPWEF
jgi:hypothetical protein